MTPEKPNEHENLSLIDTSSVVSLLKEYNGRFGLGATAAGSMMRAWEQEDRENNSIPEPEIPHDQEAEQRMSFDEMKARAESTLNATGLEYQPMKANWSASTPEGIHTGSVMRLNIKDGRQFTAYLQSLNAESITESQKSGLTEIAAVLTAQFTEYDLRDPDDDRLMEFMGNIASIISEYKRVFGDKAGMPVDISKLEIYLLYARKGCLREYREVEDLALDKPLSKDGFVLRWHTDASPAYLQERWDHVISTLAMISQNQKAAELYEIVRTHASQALESAITDVSAWPDTDRNRTPFLSILNSTKSKMSEF